jgi:putative addiction module killer protein
MVDISQSSLYNRLMPQIIESQTFQDWISTLKDREGRARINDRIMRLAAGNFGDTRSVGGGVEELRFKFGPAYRVYFLRRGNKIVVLLAGGDKGTQTKDISRAKALAQDWS